MRPMHWNRCPAVLAPIPGQISFVNRIDVDAPGRAEAEAFVAGIYRERHGARLRTFMPQLLAYHDRDGALVAVLGLRMAGEGRLFVEQYLDEPVETALALRGLAPPRRQAIAEVGNFAARSPGAAREMIVHATWMLDAMRIAWVLFTATRQLRNAFDRLHLAPVDLAEARRECLHDDSSDWGDYYATQPRVMCGNVAAGRAFLQRGFAPGPATLPELRCLAGAP